ncbi:hypothetical protein [Lysobacter sp. Root96]|uniref:hypothetical protein n=1 Tax=Lysobacter sp. Root96 TaxID=1736612 RepID=UPI0007016A6F|nr:hypothetical protein [Lysobacter sp. Root96]KRD71447.1 hypothetical protein ASE45_06460 [Lysobacter sp. Root96]
MKVEVKISGLDGVLKTLSLLPPEIVSKNGGPVKAALGKGARFLRDKEREALQRAIALHGDESTGLLVENLVASRGKAPIGSRGERYLVRFKRKVYPNRAGKPVTTYQTANLLEYGSSHQPATPFIRPTVITYGEATINVIVETLNKRIAAVVRKLAMQNKGR